MWYLEKGENEKKNAEKNLKSYNFKQGSDRSQKKKKKKGCFSLFFNTELAKSFQVQQIWTVRTLINPGCLNYNLLNYFSLSVEVLFVCLFLMDKMFHFKMF